VYVGYYEQQAQGKTIHSPKNCLPGAGWEVLNIGYAAVPVASGPVRVNRYELAREGEQALVFYWYQGRGRVQANEYAVKWDLLRDAALHGRTEEALVRIVVYLDDDTDEAGALTLATTVAEQLIPEVQGVLPS
jgi:EpsI family protein